MIQRDALTADLINDIRRLFHIVNEQSKKTERDTGITGPQLWAIKIIGDTPSIKTSELAARMYLHPATVVGILDRLEIQGLVDRERSINDRRVVNVRLTDAGYELLIKSPEVAQGLLVKGLEALTSRKLKLIHDALETLVVILDAQKIPPQLIRATEVNVNGRRSSVKR